MKEKLVPSAKQHKCSRFAVITYSFTSAICSFGLVVVLFIGSLISGAMKSFKGDKAVGLPDTEHNDNTNEDDDLPKECYPDMKTLRISGDLNYYAKQLGLEVKEYRVQTSDGFVLKLHRLIDPTHSDEDRTKMKPMLCQHGLLSSSGCFLTPGARSLPVFFLKQGYDVWLGNNRGGFAPVHAYYEGNLMHDDRYWDWDIRDLAYYDITCLIENVLANSPNYQKLVLVGHSQGCTQTFLMLRNEQLGDIHDKIENFIALAPAIYPGILFHRANFLKFIGNRSPVGYKFFFGVCCFLNFIVQTRNRFCEWPIFGVLCVKMFNFLFDWNGTLWNQNQKMWRIHFVFNVSFVSCKLMTWWISYWREDSFRNELVPQAAFDDKKHFEVTQEEKYNVDDTSTFFPYKTSWFGGGGTVVPMTIFNADEDNLVDGKRLSRHMENFEPKYKKDDNLFLFNLKRYSHLDVLWSDSVIVDIGKEVVKILNK